MAISVEDYVTGVRAKVPEARALVERLAKDHDEKRLVWQLNDDLVHLLLWSWRVGDSDACTRLLDVMESGLVDTDEDDYAPVYNAVFIGVIETIETRLQREDFAAFVETWPPEMRKQGLKFQESEDDEYDDEGPDAFPPPLGWRIRWTLRHPIRTRLGTRISYAG